MTSKWPLAGLFSEHERVQRDLSAYVDDQLSADERARVERHLAGCAECRAELESLRRTVRLLRMVPPVLPPRSFLLPAPAGSAAPPVRYSRLFFGLRNATAALAAMLVAVMAVNVVFNPPTAIAPTEGRDERALARQSAPAPGPPAAPTAEIQRSAQLAAPAKPAEKPAAAEAPAPAAAATKPAAAATKPAAAAPAKPAEAPKPAAAAPAQPAAAAKPAEPTKPAEAPKPTEAPKPAAAPESANTAKSAAAPFGAAQAPAAAPTQAPAAAPGPGQPAATAAPTPAPAAAPTIAAGSAATPAAGAAAAPPLTPEDQAARMVPAFPSTPEPSPLDAAIWALAGVALLSAAATAAVWYRDRRRA